MTETDPPPMLLWMSVAVSAKTWVSIYATGQRLSADDIDMLEQFLAIAKRGQRGDPESKPEGATP